MGFSEMSSESNLDNLLQNMDPRLDESPFVFLTSADDFSLEEQTKSVMLFREGEGMTLITKEANAQAFHRNYTNTWAFITLNIHSDLEAVGFLAKITTKLAETGISVNAVSAFYHDHLFVPWDKRMKTMELLKSFQT
jgi:hypothetical protein